MKMNTKFSIALVDFQLDTQNSYLFTYNTFIQNPLHEILSLLIFTYKQCSKL